MVVVMLDLPNPRNTVQEQLALRRGELAFTCEAVAEPIHPNRFIGIHDHIERPFFTENR